MDKDSIKMIDGYSFSESSLIDRFTETYFMNFAKAMLWGMCFIILVNPELLLKYQIIL